MHRPVASRLVALTFLTGLAVAGCGPGSADEEAGPEGETGPPPCDDGCSDEGGDDPCSRDADCEAGEWCTGYGCLPANPLPTRDGCWSIEVSELGPRWDFPVPVVLARPGGDVLVQVSKTSIMALTLDGEVTEGGGIPGVRHDSSVLAVDVDGDGREEALYSTFEGLFLLRVAEDLSTTVEEIEAGLGLGGSFQYAGSYEGGASIVSLEFGAEQRLNWIGYDEGGFEAQSTELVESVVVPLGADADSGDWVSLDGRDYTLTRRTPGQAQQYVDVFDAPVTDSGGTVFGGFAFAFGTIGAFDQDLDLLTVAVTDGETVDSFGLRDEWINRLPVLGNEDSPVVAFGGRLVGVDPEMGTFDCHDQTDFGVSLTGDFDGDGFVDALARSEDGGVWELGVLVEG